MKVLAIIPARGGSKGIPGKNIKKLGGKPLIVWSIESALNSPLVDRVIVSTDDRKIAKIAKDAGAEVPFLRPSEFALDITPDRPVFLHALSWLREQEKYEPDVLMIFKPTSPFRTERDIELVVGKIRQEGVDSVRTVRRVHEHPYWMYTKGEQGKANHFVEGLAYDKFYQRQLLPEVFVLNGLLDVLKPEVVSRDENPFGKNMYLVEIPPERSVEIDTLEDFQSAERLVEKYAQ